MSIGYEDVTWYFAWADQAEVHGSATGGEHKQCVHVVSTDTPAFELMRLLRVWAYGMAGNRLCCCSN